jgi:hypothetical protein
MSAVAHRCPRCATALIGLTTVPRPPMPRARALNHPAFFQRGEAVSALWPCLHLEAPPGPLRGHPGLQSRVVVRLIRQARPATRPSPGA